MIALRRGRVDAATIATVRAITLWRRPGAGSSFRLGLARRASVWFAGRSGRRAVLARESSCGLGRRRACTVWRGTWAQSADVDQARSARHNVMAVSTGLGVGRVRCMRGDGSRARVVAAQPCSRAQGNGLQLRLLAGAQSPSSGEGAVVWRDARWATRHDAHSPKRCGSRARVRAVVRTVWYGE